MRGFRSTELLKQACTKIAVIAGESVMYAVVETGGKQYRVAVGDVLRVEKLDVAEGGAVNLDKVLMVADGDSVRVGTPNLAGSAVTATVKAHGRGDKIRIFKFRRRKHYRKSQGHRQHYTEIEITAIK
jgi:large subunit ribosomal protein L21